MSEQIKVQAARSAQSAAAKGSLKDRFLKKTPKTAELKVVIGGETETLKFTAISSRQLDELRAKYPPSPSQRADGAGVNVDLFAPALISATLSDPELSYEEARDLWEDDSWSTGELNRLYDAASSVCLAGFDVPSNANA